MAVSDTESVSVGEDVSDSFFLTAHSPSPSPDLHSVCAIHQVIWGLPLKRFEEEKFTRQFERYFVLLNKHKKKRNEVIRQGREKR